MSVKKAFCDFLLDVHFCSQDLNVDDVMIVDSGDEIFVWIGSGANDAEKKNAFKLAEVISLLYFLFK